MTDPVPQVPRKPAPPTAAAEPSDDEDTSDIIIEPASDPTTHAQPGVKRPLIEVDGQTNGHDSKAKRPKLGNQDAPVQNEQGGTAVTTIDDDDDFEIL